MDPVEKKRTRIEEQGGPSTTFTIWDQFFLLISIAGYIFNKIIDVVLIHTYLSSGDTAWGLLTVVIVIVPQAVVHLVSYRWHVHDHEATTNLLVVHCCQLGIFLRLVTQFSDGRRWRRTRSRADSMVYLQQSSDVSLLQLFLGYMESAPQLLLQVYVTSTQDGWRLVQAVSAILSLLSLAWSNASYAKWMRKSRGDKRPLNWAAATMQLLWRLCLILARVSSLLAFSLLFSGWVLLLLAGRWMLMTVWVVRQKTDLFPAQWEERLFNAVVGVIYCFSYFNVKETPARWRMIAFYALTYAENITMATLFFFLWPNPTDWLYKTLLCNVLAGMLLGTVLMLLYYGLLHPTTGGCSACCLDFVSFASSGPDTTAKVAPSAEVAPPGGQDGGTLRSLKCRPAKRISATSLRSAGGVSLTSEAADQPAAAPAVTSHPDPTNHLSSPPALKDTAFHTASEFLRRGHVTRSIKSGAGHVTISAASLPAAGESHVIVDTDRRHQSASAILQTCDDTDGPRSSDIPQLDLVSEGDITLPSSPLSPGTLPSSPLSPGATQLTHEDHSRNTGCREHLYQRSVELSQTGDSSRPQGDAPFSSLPPADVPYSSLTADSLLPYSSLPPHGLPPPPASSDGAGDSTCANHSRMTSSTSAPPPDYENFWAVNMHREELGVRAWRTYSLLAGRAHDTSVNTDRAGRLCMDGDSTVVGDDGSVLDAGDCFNVSATAGRHTYENTDNVALMIAHMDEEATAPGKQEGDQERRRYTGDVGPLRDVTQSRLKTSRSKANIVTSQLRINAAKVQNVKRTTSESQPFRSSPVINQTRSRAGLAESAALESSHLDRRSSRPQTDVPQGQPQPQLAQTSNSSLLVATIDTVERSAVSALFSSPPRPQAARRSRSTDDLSGVEEAEALAEKRRLNTSFDPSVMMDYVTPKSPPEAIYARPKSMRERRKNGGRNGIGVESGRESEGGGVKPLLRGGPGQHGLQDQSSQTATHRSQAMLGKHHSKENNTCGDAANTNPTSSTARRNPSHPSYATSYSACGPSTALHPTTTHPPQPSSPLPSSSTRTPLSPNTPAAASPRRKFSLLRARFEPAGRRYAVSVPSVQAVAGGVKRRPSLQEAARALWASRGKSKGKENTPPPLQIQPHDPLGPCDL